ncbi:type I-F CRISPR-associated protein Csy2 [Salinisphaera sp. SWV1]|uniref:type I-F CRISPR-associated protein Csy2 n=1 Tax=Salinisphaera sp. SWV1 TaxID=3454139 RepID=UPI003F83D7FA
MSDIDSLLVLPHLRVQNANAISAPLTWGFPAMSAFVGLMHALERRLHGELDLLFHGVGVICHAHDVQISRSGYTRRFHLTRNPVQDRKYVKKDGSTDVPAIAEEGRMHMEITVVFDVTGEACSGDDAERAERAHRVDEIVHGMRIAGGSVLPRRPNQDRNHEPILATLPDDEKERGQHFRDLRRRWLPGFALVLREDRLEQRHVDLRATNETATRLDAWLDFSRLHHQSVQPVDDAGEPVGKPAWEIRRSPGWTVPIPVGYGALGDEYEPGQVARARDDHTPFRFVESLYSIGEWVGPHRLRRPESLLWYIDNDLDQGIYRLNNDYAQSATS